MLSAYLSAALAFAATDARSFSRAMGPKVSARDVVNVLGRWRTIAEWDAGVGVLAQLDPMVGEDGRRIVNKDGEVVDDLRNWTIAFDDRKYEVQRRGFASDYYAVVADDAAMEALTSDENDMLLAVAASPNRRAWCKRQGMAQRYWHNANIGSLPFTSESLASSVGSSVVEMQALPVNPLAADLCFDALARSQSGIVDKELCQERRLSYETSDGAFAADAFAADLGLAQRNYFGALAIYPGSMYLIGAVVFLQVDGWAQLQDYVYGDGGLLSRITANLALWGRMMGGGA